jgi:vitamin B12 transporter
VVNIIRRKVISAGGGYWRSNVEAGSFGSLEATAEGGVQRGMAKLSGGITYLESDGTNISRGPGEDDGNENLTAGARLELDASDTLRFTFSGQQIDTRNDFDGTSFVSGLPADSDEYTEADRTYLSAVAGLNAPGSRWDGTASVNWLDSDNVNYSFGAWNSSTAAQTLEWRLRASAGLDKDNPLDHRLSLALDYRDVDFSQRGAASAFGDPNQDQSYNVAGYAAEYVGRPIQGFTWTLSARQDDFSDFDDVATWQLAASKRFESGYRLRGSIGTGSKAPTFIERFGFFPDLFQGNPNLQPESSRGWELGIDAPLGRSLLTLSATWFDQDLKDEIDGFVFDPETFLFTAVNRPGTSHRQGLELVLEGALSPKLWLNASYTYTDATEFSVLGGEGPEVRRPEHVGSLNLNQTFGEGRGNLNLDVNYNGAQIDNFFPPPEFAQVQVELDHFVLVDLAASWSLTPWLEITGRVTNLLDEEYEEILGFVGPGRGVFAGLRGHF